MAYNFDTLPFTVISKNARDINLGLVTLSTDLTIENEMQFFLGDGKKSLLHSRIKSKDEVNTSNLREMKEHFKECLSLFPPNHKYVLKPENDFFGSKNWKFLFFINP